MLRPRKIVIGEDYIRKFCYEKREPIIPTIRNRELKAMQCRCSSDALSESYIVLDKQCMACH